MLPEPSQFIMTHLRALTNPWLDVNPWITCMFCHCTLLLVYNREMSSVDLRLFLRVITKNYCSHFYRSIVIYFRKSISWNDLVFKAVTGDLRLRNVAYLHAPAFHMHLLRLTGTDRGWVKLFPC